MSENTKNTELETPGGATSEQPGGATSEQPGGATNKGDGKKGGKNKENPWKKMEWVELPRAGRNEQNFQEVSVNGRYFQVPRGRPVEVPAPVAEAIRLSNEAKDYADKRKEEMIELSKTPIYR